MVSLGDRLLHTDESSFFDIDKLKKDMKNEKRRIKRAKKKLEIYWYQTKLRSKKYGKEKSR